MQPFSWQHASQLKIRYMFLRLMAPFEDEVAESETEFKETEEAETEETAE